MTPDKIAKARAEAWREAAEALEAVSMDCHDSECPYKQCDYSQDCNCIWSDAESAIRTARALEGENE